MNLIWFLTIATILSTVLGEFGQFPFGSPTSVSLTDILLGITLSLLFIWKIAIKQNLSSIQKKIFSDFTARPEEFKILVLFWVVGIVGLFFSGNLHGGLYLIRFIFYSSSFLIGYFLVAEKKIIVSDLFRLFAISGFVFLILGFLQLLILPNFNQLSLLGYDPHQNRLTSTFLDPNFGAAFLVIALVTTVILFLNFNRKEWIIIGFLELVGLALTFSRSGYLMFLVTFGLFGILKEKKMLFLITPILIAALLVPQISARILGGLTLDSSSASRIESWQNGLFIFYKNPVLGVGFDNLRDVFSRYNLFETFSENGGNAGAGVDSSLIFVLATTGLVGFLTFIWFWFKILKTTFLGKISKSNSLVLWGCLLIGLQIDSQFINSLFYPPIMLMIYLASGSLVATKSS